jgi:transcription elongation GreA/GreB family factor
MRNTVKNHNFGPVEFKKKLYEMCLAVARDKIIELDAAISQVEEGLNSETKSTSGDKHETGRAMLQLEREKLGGQLMEITARKNELERLDISSATGKINNGSLVETDKGSFFIAAALGKVQAGNKIVYVISAVSPLGKKLMGLKAGDCAEINGVSYLIKAVS